MKKWTGFLLVPVLCFLLTACGEQKIHNGTYRIDCTLSGGSGRAAIEAAQVTIDGEKITARITWSSPFYDYMLIDGVRYEPIQESGNAVFEIPAVLDQDMAVSADTVAMSQPHLIAYKLYFDSSTMEGESE